MRFFQLFLTFKVQTVDEIIQSAYLRFILHVKQKKKKKKNYPDINLISNSW